MSKLAPLAVLVLLSSACGPAAGSGGNPDGSVTTDPCTGTETRCVGQTYQVCENGFYVEDQACSTGDTCVPDLGCAACNPNWGKVCSGDNVHACTSDGQIGEVLETCDFEQCSNGACRGDDDCASGADLIYVVDKTYRLFSFDPKKLGSGDPYTLIGNISCPAGAPWPEWQEPTATPFSMSVDRDARAWVLFTSGEIFHVSTTDASCQASGFVKGQQDFKLFGMGFVSDTMGSSSESLYIAGGPVSASQTGRLGRIDPTTLQVTDIGPLPSAEYSPELTGTGAAELFGYYPGSFKNFVARVGKTTGSNEQEWPMSPLQNNVTAWAFAHWGGDFYIFVTTSSGDIFFPEDVSNVHRLDPETGNVETVLSDTGKMVVGAGVSTCAPIVVE